jgi:molecular chaperone DnaJ
MDRAEVGRMPGGGLKGPGDLLAEVQVAVPSHLDDAAREALQRFHELEPKDNPRADLMSRARG